MTRRTLLRLRWWLIVTAVLCFIAATAVLTGTYGTADRVRERTSQAVLEVAAARSGLVEADAAAVRSFASGEAELAGPGEEHLGQLALAGQSLARVAEANEAGEPGSRTLQVIEGLLAAYRAAIGQADAHFRAAAADRPDAATLGVAHLWDASRLLHAPGELLDQLDVLAAEQRHALDEQLTTGWFNPLTIPLWTIPLLVLLALLLGTQRFLARRFRRTANVPLVLATAALLIVGAGLGFTLGSQGKLRDTTAALDQVVSDSDTRALVVDAAGRQRLAALVTDQCGRGCGVTVAGFVANAPPTAGDPGDAQEKKVSDGAKDANSSAADAADGAGRSWWIPALILLIGALAAAGLQTRIDDYRYSDT